MNHTATQRLAPLLAVALTAAEGTAQLPPFSGGKTTSDVDWALKLR